MILREKAMETQVHNLSINDKRGGGSTGHGNGNYFLDLDECLPLYLCLGSPVYNNNNNTPTYHTNHDHNDRRTPPHDNDIDLTLYDLGDFPDSSGSETGSEWWEEENKEDPYDNGRLQAEREAAEADPMYTAQLFWAMRKAQRRFRAAKGKFGPRKKFAPRRIGKRFTRRGPSAPRGRYGGSGSDGGRRGFFIGEHFVSLECVPEPELKTFFAGKKGKGGGKGGGAPKDVRCYKCGKPGHMAASCPSSESLCFNCGKPGHIGKDCKQGGSSRAMAVWGASAMFANEGSTPDFVQLGASLAGVECDAPSFAGVTYTPSPPEPHEQPRPQRPPLLRRHDDDHSPPPYHHHPFPPPQPPSSSGEGS